MTQPSDSEIDASLKQRECDHRPVDRWVKPPDQTRLEREGCLLCDRWLQPVRLRNDWSDSIGLDQEAFARWVER